MQKTSSTYCTLFKLNSGRTELSTILSTSLPLDVINKNDEKTPAIDEIFAGALITLKSVLHYCVFPQIHLRMKAQCDIWIVSSEKRKWWSHITGMLLVLIAFQIRSIVSQYIHFMFSSSCFLFSTLHSSQLSNNHRKSICFKSLRPERPVHRHEACCKTEEIVHI